MNTVEKRIYLTGNTFPVKDEIKAAGGKWDKERKQWWVTPAMVPAMKALAAKVAALPKANKLTPKLPPDNHAPIVGEAVVVKERQPALITWSGRLKNGPATGRLFFRLITMDGSKAFWKPAKQVRVVRRFEEPQPLGHILHQLAAARAEY